MKRGSAINILTPTANKIATVTVGRLSAKKLLTEFSCFGTGGACLGSVGGLSDDIEMLAGYVLILGLLARV
jgi:hypothetical protein